MKEFYTLMESKMILNSHKGGWDRLKLADLMKLLKGEMKELQEAIDNEDYKEISMEAADVANYAMMIADKCVNRRLV